MASLQPFSASFSEHGIVVRPIFSNFSRIDFGRLLPEGMKAIGIAIEKNFVEKQYCQKLKTHVGGLVMLGMDHHYPVSAA